MMAIICHETLKDVAQGDIQLLIVGLAHRIVPKQFQRQSNIVLESLDPYPTGITVTLVRGLLHASEGEEVAGRGIVLPCRDFGAEFKIFCGLRP
jgi:hypothetical protein